MSKQFYTSFFNNPMFYINQIINIDIGDYTNPNIAPVPGTNLIIHPMLNLGSMIFPEINFIKFTDIINNHDPQNPNFIRTEGIFKEILKGIYLINQRGLVHNDLHSNNIMIERDTGKVMIYDWDRSYMNGNDNPMLSRDTRIDPCVNSQCNIFIPGRPIDLLKILIYVSDNRPYFNYILQNALGIDSNLHNVIYEGITMSSPGNKFYNNGISNLYQIYAFLPLEIAILFMGGTLEIIYLHSNGELNQQLTQQRDRYYQEAVGKLQDIRGGIIQPPPPDIMEVEAGSMRAQFAFDTLKQYIESHDYEQKENNYFSNYRNNEEHVSHSPNNSLTRPDLDKLRNINTVPFSEILQQNEIRKNKNKLCG
jgi:hypothetical protein